MFRNRFFQKKEKDSSSDFRSCVFAVRKRFQFYGHVQGVGFRFTAKAAANSLGLTGWVRNEYDGTVLMEVQGDESAIRQLLDSLKEDSYIQIDFIDERDLAFVPDEKGFSTKW